jgi:FrmR/RcnR family transcriptional regulator, repressor of frmRAB operon
MTHTSKEKSKLLSRLSRIRGQLDAVQRALDEGGSCTAVLQQATACRGALDGFIAEIIEDHIREHLVGSERSGAARGRAAEELIEIVHSYLT